MIVIAIIVNYILLEWISIQTLAFKLDYQSNSKKRKVCFLNKKSLLKAPKVNSATGISSLFSIHLYSVNTFLHSLECC